MELDIPIFSSPKLMRNPGSSDFRNEKIQLGWAEPKKKP
jgi:hypothetical protein